MNDGPAYWHLHGQIKAMQCVIEAMLRCLSKDQRAAVAKAFAAETTSVEAALLNSPGTSESQIESVQHSLKTWADRLR